MACQEGAERCQLGVKKVCVKKPKKDNSGYYTTWQSTGIPCIPPKKKKK